MIHWLRNVNTSELQLNNNDSLAQKFTSELKATSVEISYLSVVLYSVTSVNGHSLEDNFFQSPPLSKGKQAGISTNLACICWRRLHVFPPLWLEASFPALGGARNFFSCSRCRYNELNSRSDWFITFSKPKQFFLPSCEGGVLLRDKVVTLF